MNQNRFWDKFSEWQRKTDERHPLWARFWMRVLSGLAIAFLTAAVGIPWAAKNIPSQLVYDDVPNPPDSTEITIENKGFIPATAEYKLVSEDTAITSVNLLEGERHVSIEDTPDSKIKALKITGLGKTDKVRLNIVGSDTVTVRDVFSDRADLNNDGVEEFIRLSESDVPGY